MTNLGGGLGRGFPFLNRCLSRTARIVERERTCKLITLKRRIGERGDGGGGDMVPKTGEKGYTTTKHKQ